jgi:hypothetical protein
MVGAPPATESTPIAADVYAAKQLAVARSETRITLVVESLRVKAVPTKKHRLLLAGANELKAKGASTLTVRLKAINVGAACLF